MQAFNQFLELFKAVWIQGIFGINVSEIIIGTDASIEGDSTALFLTEILKDYPLKITRLARGLPIGGTIEHVDQTTLSKSIDDRIEL